MPIVKAKNTTLLRQSAIVMDLSDIESQAGRLVADARAQAAAIVEQARAQAQSQVAAITEQARKAGEEKGYAEGLGKGQQQGHADALAAVQGGVESLVNAWTVVLDKFQAGMPTHLADAQTDVVRLAIAIAAHVTHQEALWNRGVAEETIKAALQLVTDGRHVTLAVNPDEAQFVEQFLPTLLSKIKSIEQVEIAPDSAISAGGCMVRFGSGQIDARLETQIERIATELLVEQRDEVSAHETVVAPAPPEEK